MVYFDVIFGLILTKILSDTDSLLVDIPCNDLYETLHQISDHLDLSNYPEDHALYNPTNKGVLGKFKDECAGNIIKVIFPCV